MLRTWASMELNSTRTISLENNCSCSLTWYVHQQLRFYAKPICTHAFDVCTICRFVFIMLTSVFCEYIIDEHIIFTRSMNDVPVQRINNQVLHRMTISLFFVYSVEVCAFPAQPLQETLTQDYICERNKLCSITTHVQKKPAAQDYLRRRSPCAGLLAQEKPLRRTTSARHTCTGLFVYFFVHDTISSMLLLLVNLDIDFNCSAITCWTWMFFIGSLQTGLSL